MRRHLKALAPLATWKFWNPLAGPLYVVPHLIIILALVFGAFTAGVFTGRHYPSSTGYMQAPLPPTQRIAGGPLPSSWSLEGDITRLHNQGDSNSCVAQTISEMVEIIQHQRHNAEAFSPGFIWNQLNGGVDQGLTYPAAFGLLQSSGDAPSWAFSPDGLNTDYAVPVPSSAFTAAYPFRVQSWMSLAADDQYSIEASIHAGVPVAFAIPVYTSFYNNFGDGYVPYITGESGNFLFYHSMLIVGYDASGPYILNSWANWSGNQIAHLSWSFLPDENAALVTVTPLSYTPPKPPKAPKPALTKAQARVWNEYRSEHHLKLIPPKDKHGNLTHAALLWRHQKPSAVGGIVRSEQWHPEPHAGGYEEDTFQGKTLFWWVHHPHWKAKWQAHRWVR